MKEEKQKGYPVIISVKRTGVVTTMILAFGGTRILYDLVPVVSFHGWPAVAMGWLTENHYWDGIVPEEDGRLILLVLFLFKCIYKLSESSHFEELNLCIYYFIV